MQRDSASFAEIGANTHSSAQLMRWYCGANTTLKTVVLARRGKPSGKAKVCKTLLRAGSMWRNWQTR
jgi:hypothetical protein